MKIFKTTTRIRAIVALLAGACLTAVVGVSTPASAEGGCALQGSWLGIDETGPQALITYSGKSANSGESNIEFPNLDPTVFGAFPDGATITGVGTHGRQHLRLRPRRHRLRRYGHARGYRQVRRRQGDRGRLHSHGGQRDPARLRAADGPVRRRASRGRPDNRSPRVPDEGRSLSPREETRPC